MTGDDTTTFGISVESHLTSDHEKHAEKIRLTGYSVTPVLYDDQMITAFASATEEVLHRQHDEVGGEENLISEEERNIARALAVYDERFLEVLTNTYINKIIDALLGSKYIVNQQNGVFNPAQSVKYTPAYHRDLPYQHFYSSTPLGITAILCLDEFDQKTGATVVIPGSHKTEAFPGLKLSAEIEVSITAPRGSFILLDAMLFHRTGNNKTNDIRRAIAQTYTLPFIKQIISLPTCFGDKYSTDGKLSFLLGYGTESGINVPSWRQSKGLAKSPSDPRN